MSEFKPQPVPDPYPTPRGKTKLSAKTIAKDDSYVPSANTVSFDEMDAIAPGENLLPPDAGKPDGKFKEFFRSNKWYILASVLGLLIIAVLAFFAFRKQTPEPTKKANIALEIIAPDTAPTGGEVIYKIQITNNDSADLVGMNLELVYDDGVTYVSSTPPADNAPLGSRFPVPDLGTGQNAVLMIKTMASGNVNEQKRLTAKLRYKFSNFNSEFTEETTQTLRLVAADIILDVTGPEKITTVVPAKYDIFYRNDSEKSISNARIQVTYPSEFKFDSSEPSPSLGKNIWNISNLGKNESGKISFTGNFDGARTGQAVIFKIEFLAQDDAGGFFTQSSTTYMTNIDSQPLSVEQKLLNQGQSQNNVVNPGESLQYELKFQNNTNVVATGLSVVAQVDSKAVDSSSIRADGGLVEANTITWNASSVPKLEKLNPGESGTIQFSVQVKDPAVKDSSKNLTVVTSAKIKSNENRDFLQGNNITIKIASPASIQRSMTTVSGAIPPKVGQDTTVQVSVAIRNSSNDLREGVMVGYIPLGVNFDKSSVVSTENAAVKYDSATGKITWTVGKLAAHSGSSVPLRTLKFNVSFKPTANQVGQQVTLFKTISFSAKDDFTEQAISLKSQDISTDDLPGEGQGRVQP